MKKVMKHLLKQDIKFNEICRRYFISELKRLNNFDQDKIKSLLKVGRSNEKMYQRNRRIYNATIEKTKKRKVKETIYSTITSKGKVIAKFTQPIVYSGEMIKKYLSSANEFILYSSLLDEIDGFYPLDCAAEDFGRYSIESLAWTMKVFNKYRKKSILKYFINSGGDVEKLYKECPPLKEIKI